MFMHVLCRVWRLLVHPIANTVSTRVRANLASLHLQTQPVAPISKITGRHKLLLHCRMPHGSCRQLLEPCGRKQLSSSPKELPKQGRQLLEPCGSKQWLRSDPPKNCQSKSQHISHESWQQGSNINAIRPLSKAARGHSSWDRQPQRGLWWASKVSPNDVRWLRFQFVPLR